MRKLDDEQRKEVIRLYQSGLGTPQVAVQFNCGAEAIRRILIEEGIPRRNRSEAIKLGSDNPESRRKRSESHKGKKKPPVSEETRKKMSENSKKRWENSEYRERAMAAITKAMNGRPNPFSGKKHSEETKAIISQKAKERFKDPEFKDKMMEIFSESRGLPSWKERQSIARKKLWQTEEFKEKVMHGLINNPTSLEIRFMEILESMGIAYEYQYIISRAIPDFFITGTNKIIETDGDYWHSKPEQKLKDIKRDKWLESQGYEILRLTETEVMKGDPKPKIIEFLKR